MSALVFVVFGKCTKLRLLLELIGGTDVWLWFSGVRRAVWVSRVSGSVWTGTPVSLLYPLEEKLHVKPDP